MSQLDRQRARLNVESRQLQEAELSVRKYGRDIERAQRELPRRVDKTRRAIDKADTMIGRIRDAARKEAAQKGEVDEQVAKQQDHIEQAARDLAKQARESRANLTKWMTAAVVRRRLAAHAYNRALHQMYEGIHIAIYRNRSQFLRFFAVTLFRAKRALAGGRSRVYAAPPSLPLPSGHPSSENIVAAGERIAKVNDAKAKFEKKVGAQRQKIVQANKKLAKRRADAHRKIDAALQQRSQQLSRWTDRKEQLKQSLARMAERRQKIDAAKQDQSKRLRAIARRKAQLSKAREYLRRERVKR